MSRNYSEIVYAIVIIQVSVVFCATLRRDVGVDKLHQKLEADEELVIILAEEICNNLQTYHNESSPFTIEDCQNSFIKSHGEKFAAPPKVGLRCQYQSNIVYSLETAQVHEPDSWTLLVLTPLNTSVNYLTYDLVKTNDEFRDLNVFPPGYYTLWTAQISKFGTHSSWLKGPDIKTWNLTGEFTLRSHHIRTTPQFQAANDNSTVTVSINWDPIDDKDKCFDFVNKCNGVLNATKIRPDGGHSRKVAGLPLGASCEVRLRGRHGLTVKRYQTPTCDEMDACLNYNMAQNVSLMAEPAADGWDIYVHWARTHQPLFYNVTLFTENGTASVQLPGNTTETMFPGVQGDGIYTVAIGSMYKGRTVYTSERAMFPPEAARWGALGSIMGGAWGVLACSGVLLVTAILLWRRKQHGRPTHIYFPEPMDKPDGAKADCDGIDQESLAAEDCWELPSERLLLHEVIGEGAFGVVRRGTLSPAGKEVAVKMLKDFPTLEEIRSFLAEMELMKSVGAHAHIVSMLGCCGGRRPFIVAEYCGRGDLLSYLRRSWDMMVSKRNAKYYNNNIESTDYRNDLFKCNPSDELSKLVVNKLYDLQGLSDPDLTIRDLLSFCRQIAMGMEFLASNRLVHRDLAARNVLVSSDRTLKIADFGLSRDVYEENLYKQKGNGKMPMKWMALESLTRRIYTTQSDVWSFGVVMWEVSSVGGAPYAGVAPARLPRLLRAGYRMPRPANCTKQLYEVMLSCWRAHPRERPTFGELHARLDELLGAAAQEYLCLQDCDDLPPPARKYVPTIIRDKLGWFRGESYERPLRTTHNHYTSPPATHKLQQVS